MENSLRNYTILKIDLRNLIRDFLSDLQLFPLFGFEIGITTDMELESHEEAIKDDEMGFVTVRSVAFWYNGPYPVFSMMYLVRGIDILPQ